ncbi:MAG TPA: hypothetical protein VM737_01205 [Gemmatimonadota bacterium]|nr:hypothetical protein [Gemmatimonadota bacterium]
MASSGNLLGQALEYAPEPGSSFDFRTANTLTVSQRVLGRENHYTLGSEGVVRLTLLSAGARLQWRLGFEEIELRIEGAFPTPRTDALKGTVVTVTTTPRGVVLDALASGVVPPGVGAQYVERAAAAFFPRLPAIPDSDPENPGAVSDRTTWGDTLTVTEVLQGVTTEVETILTYTIADTSALAGRSVVPVDYEGQILLTGAGTIGGSRVVLRGGGRVAGNYLYDPEDRIFDLHEQEQVVESTLTLEGPDTERVEIPSRQVLRARAERLF